MGDTNTYRRKLDALKRDLEAARRSQRTEEGRLQEAMQSVESCAKASHLLQSAAEAVQQHAHRQIAAVVTRAIRAVYGDDSYEFRVIFEQKRGRTEATLALARGDHCLTDPMAEAGGGVVDVAALALRLSCLVLTRPPARRLLLLDEPFRNINGSTYQARAGEVLEQLASELRVQMVIVTDDDWLKIGQCIDLGD